MASIFLEYLRLFCYAGREQQPSVVFCLWFVGFFVCVLCCVLFCPLGSTVMFPDLLSPSPTNECSPPACLQLQVAAASGGIWHHSPLGPMFALHACWTLLPCQKYPTSVSSSSLPSSLLIRSPFFVVSQAFSLMNSAVSFAVFHSCCSSVLLHVVTVSSLTWNSFWTFSPWQNGSLEICTFLKVFTSSFLSLAKTCW